MRRRALFKQNAIPYKRRSHSQRHSRKKLVAVSGLGALLFAAALLTENSTKAPQTRKAESVQSEPRSAASAEQLLLPPPAETEALTAAEPTFSQVQKRTQETTDALPPSHLSAMPTEDGFSCGPKRYCGEMNSCEEAEFYYQQCGLSRLDRDNDGIPCESICGG
jgi:hypothetical protein